MKKILIIEDDRDIIEVLQMALEEDGYGVIATDTGSSGLELARSIRPDMILLGVLLPDINGINICRSLKSDKDFKSIPIILLTALDDIGNTVKGLTAGANDYVSKPFVLRELLARMKSHLRVKELYDATKKEEEEKTKASWETLQLERNKLKAILEAMEDGAYIVNPNYEVEYINPKMEEIFGSVEGRKCYEYLHDRVEVCTNCKNEEVFSGKAIRSEWDSPKNKKYYLTISTPIKNPDGSVSKFEIFHDITERRQAEEALRSSEERYRMLVETMNDGMGVQNENNVFTYVNDRLCEMLDYRRDEMLGKSISLLFDASDLKNFEVQFERRKRGDHTPYEINMKKKDGEKIFVLISPRPIFDDGQFKGSIAVITDITARKEAEMELWESEERLQAILDNASTIIHLKDTKGKYILVDRQFEILANIAKERIVGKTDFDIFPENIAKIFSSGDQKVLETGLPLETEAMVPFDEKTSAYFIIKFPLIDSSGTPYAVCGIITDITERKRAEEALRQSEQRYRTLVQSLPDIIYKIDQEGCFTFLSDSIRNLGYEPEELVGKHFKEIIHPDDINAVSSSVVLAKYAGKKTGDAQAPKVFDERRSGKRMTRNLEVRLVGKKWVEKQNDPPEIVGAIFFFGEVDASGEFGIEENPKEKNHIRTAGIIRDITERKKAEKTLKESEEKYRALVDNAYDAILLADMDGNLLDANKKAEDLLGYSKKELMTLHITKIHAPESLERALETFKEMVETGTVFFQDGLALRKDGGKVPVDITGAVFEYAGKKAAMGIFRDMTEPKKVIEEFKKYKLLFDNVSDLAFICDTNGNILFVNKIFEKLTGHKLQEFIGKPFAPLFDEKNLQKAMEVYQRTLEGEAPAFELCFKNTGILCEYKSFPLKDAAGNTIGIFGIARDMTDRIKSEEALTISETRFQDVAANTGDWIWEVDVEGKYTYSSPVVEKVIGYRPEEIIGKYFYELFSPDERENLKKVAFEVFAKKEIFRNFPNCCIHKNGQRVMVETSGMPITNSAGKLLGYRGADRDITEQKLAEERAKRQQEKLIQADKMISLGNLVAGVAHEISNPNNSITLNVPSIQDLWRDAKPLVTKSAKIESVKSLANLPMEEGVGLLEELLTAIQHDSERITKIVSGLKDFARTDTKGYGSEVDIENVINSSVKLIDSLIKQSTHQFSINLTPLPSVRGNFQKLEQVFVNLIINACQALTDINQAVEIKTSHEQKHGRVTIQVKDQGRGMKKEVLGRVMEPFFTTRQSSGGTGLGVSISYGIVREHGGTMEYKSEPSKGTTVTIALPVADSN